MSKFKLINLFESSNRELNFEYPPIESLRHDNNHSFCLSLCQINLHT